MIMAGGRGTRLAPLTVHRAKPAVPFGGRYRIIDFVLSNVINSGYRRVFVLTQFMASSLIKHLNRNWRLSSFGEFIEIVPAQMRMGAFWYRGTADAVSQNLNLIRDARAQAVAIFGGDHVYKLALDQMETFHHETGADLTVAAYPVPLAQGREFGIIDVDGSWKIRGFVEKPENPPPMPGNPAMCLASMGNYFFRTKVLEKALVDDLEDPESAHDFGRDIIPRLLSLGARVYAYDFGQNRIPGEIEGATPYWRDVVTIESYFEANMDLRARVPELNAYNRAWRIRTAQRDYPPARFVRDSATGRSADIVDSLVCEGAIISGARLYEALIGYDCFIHADSEIQDSVILSGCDVGRGADLRRVLMDKNCKIAPGAQIGVDPELDRQRFPFISRTGIVSLPKGTFVPADGPIQLAADIAHLIQNDPKTSASLERLAGRIDVSPTGRYSHASAGPRYLMYDGRPGTGPVPIIEMDDDR
jgi:glucose-1-phosphate adenylyltransferase